MFNILKTINNIRSGSDVTAGHKTYLQINLKPNTNLLLNFFHYGVRNAEAEANIDCCRLGESNQQLTSSKKDQRAETKRYKKQKS